MPVGVIARPVWRYRGNAAGTAMGGRRVGVRCPLSICGTVEKPCCHGFSFLVRRWRERRETTRGQRIAGWEREDIDRRNYYNPPGPFAGEAEAVCKKLEKAMCDAGEEYVKKVPVKVDAHVHDEWTK